MGSIKLCYYGDDFTGSTDSMEALTSNGFRTILFLEVPSPEIIHQQFSDIDCFGIAGVSRQMNVEEMEHDLRPVLEQLKKFNTPIVHYKTCSTFDSSPKVGNIGKVIEMGMDIFSEQKYIPLVIGVPPLKRYTLFGNLFVTVDNVPYRLDRHPTMSRHPVTPMDEADLRIHLNKQTDKKIGLLDVLDLSGDISNVKETYQKRIYENPDVLLFDILEDEHLFKAAKLIWSEAQNTQQFVVGSSGVEYAFGDYWRRTQIHKGSSISKSPINNVNQLLVVSGSCSPVTQAQIEWGLENNFEGIKISSQTIIDRNQQEDYLIKILKDALDILKTGKNLIMYTALGPDDPSIPETKKFLTSIGMNSYNSGQLIGKNLGRLTRKLIEEVNLKRVVIAGGDTSGFVIKELELFALEMIKNIDPGGPLCRVYSKNEQFNDLEISLKGGQVGKQDYFGKALCL